ncbi:MAG: DUF4443 domain-containing protein [Candidatus Helarchaeota archaeon]
MKSGKYISRTDIKNILANRPAGPRSSYNIYHFERVLRIISKKAPIGRNKLQEEINLGAGSIRTLIKIIKSLNLIETTVKGLLLTELGNETVKAFEKNIPFDPILVDVPKDTSLAGFNAILIVRNGSKNLKSGLEQTTAALRIDASGALTILFKNNKFSMPGIAEDLEKSNPKLVARLKEILQVKPDDVIIVGMGNSEEKAIMGAWAAAYSLLNL